MTHVVGVGRAGSLRCAARAGRSRLNRLLVSLAVLGLLLFATRTASAANYVVYFHGRSMGTWPSYGLVFVPNGWQHIALTYNGDARMADPTARSQVSSALKAYCSGGNQCIAVCYSAGCPRMLFGLNDLTRAGTPAKGVLWTEATASASGGTEAVRYLNSWFKTLLARIFGLTADVDHDLDPNTMLGTYAYIQGGVPSPWYDSQGSHNICMDIFFFKICANQYIQSVADGAVPAHSGCGYTDAGAHSSCCDGKAKFNNHQADACAVYPQDHYGMFAVGVIEASARFGFKNPLAFAHGWAGNSAPNANPAFDDGYAKVNTSDSPTIAGALNITPPYTAGDTRPDGCVACDATGCAHCRQFSVVQSGYNTCNALTCTPTLSTEATVPLQGAWPITVTGGTTVTIGAQHCSFGICTGPAVFTTKAGVTVTLGGSTEMAYCMGASLTSIALNASDQVALTYQCSPFSGLQPQTVTLAFHGATVYSSGLNGIVQATGSVSTTGNMINFFSQGSYYLGPSSQTFYVVANSNLH